MTGLTRHPSCLTYLILITPLIVLLIPVTKLVVFYDHVAIMDAKLVSDG